MAILVAALALAVGAGGSRPHNLIATPQVKAALRAAHLRTVQPADRAGTRGPLRGQTYYGSYGTRFFALATFSHPRVGTTDQPEVFVRRAGGGWRDLGDTGGCIPTREVPAPLLRLWGFDPAGPGCYI